MWFAWIAAAVLVLDGCGAFYLPGVRPTDFSQNQEVMVKVSKLDSTHTQLPYDYYSLPFCPPPPGSKRTPENLGEYLLGERIEPSSYKVSINSNENCKILCKRVFTQSERIKLMERIKEQYRVNVLLDDLPGFTKEKALLNGKPIDLYEEGFALGEVRKGSSGKSTVLLNNHVQFWIALHPVDDSKFRIVGFELISSSINHKYEQWNEDNPFQTVLSTCPGPSQEHQILEETSPNDVVFTYDVHFENSDVRWASRWDVYLKMPGKQIHWFSIVSSLTIVLFLTGMVAIIFIRTLRSDLARYNLERAPEDIPAEETGWKLVHGDVFRTPKHADKLSVLVGSGAQVLGMTIVTVFFSAFGFLSPKYRGSILTAIVILFVLMGFPAGYIGTRFHRMLGLTNWKLNAFRTAIWYPGFNFGVFLFLDTFVWAQGSSAAIPFVEIFALLLLWFGISFPLVYFSSSIAQARPAPPAHPVQTNAIPRQIPVQPWFLRPPVSVILPGILPFGAVFVEAFFILSSLWLHTFYSFFGFLLTVMFILAITCIELSIVTVYFQLCAEDYHWWWRSFLTPGSSALYLFFYSIFYFVSRLEIAAFVPTLLFFSYTLLISMFFFMLTGTIGLLSSLFFVRAIYAAVKID